MEQDGESQVRGRCPDGFPRIALARRPETVCHIYPNRAMIQAYSTRMEQLDDKDWSERFEKAQPKPGAARIYIGAVILFFKLILELAFSFHPGGILPWSVGSGLIVFGLLSRKSKAPPEPQ